MSKKIQQLEISFTPPCGITDKPKSMPQAWDAESLWEQSLSDSISTFFNADEIDTYDLMVGEVLIS